MSKQTNTIGDLIDFAKSAPYNEDRRAAFKRHASAFLRDIIKGLEHGASKANIRYNPGGIAGSGDAILHTSKIYVHINDFGCYYRTVKHDKDYTGGHNNCPSDAWTAEEFAKNINALLSRNFATV